MPLESPPRKRTCRLATAAACLAARAPLAPFPSSDGLVPRVVAVGIQFKRVWLARLEAVREQERAPDPVLLVHPPPRPLAWSVPEGGVDRRLVLIRAMIRPSARSVESRAQAPSSGSI